MMSGNKTKIISSGFFEAVVEKYHLIIVIITAVSLTSLEKVIPDVIYRLYAYPAALIASAFLGSGVVFDNGEIFIPLSKYTIHVIPGCSAYGFSCLLSAIVAFYLLRVLKLRKALLFLLSAVPLIYILTIITNGFRIICAYCLNRVSGYFLPENFRAALHQGVGIILFFSVILFVSYIFERKLKHGQYR